MLDEIPWPSSTPLLGETHGRGEDRLPLLSCLHRPCCEALPISDSFHVVQDRDGGVTGENEVAVHAVDGEVGGNSVLGSGEALRDGGAAENAPRPWRMPEGARVRVDVWADVGEREEGEDGFDRRVGGVWGVRVVEGRVFRHFRYF